MTGFLLIDKTVGPTSHDVIDRVRRLTGERRVGHAGTLDPFASGLLIVGVGREATREFPKLSGLDKRYRAVLRLGATSDTDDRTGRIIVTPAQAGVQSPLDDQSDWIPAFAGMTEKEMRKKIIETLQRFTGKIEQIPPIYSAKKIGGRKLYEYARRGEHVARRPSPVEIYSIAIVKYSLLNTPYSLTLDIHCSSGTYIRALARDMGEALGCGAYLEELERTAIGPFQLEEATKVDDLTKENIETHFLDIDSFIMKSEAAKQSFLSP